MAGKLVELQQAAKLLGITPDQLSEMRSRSEIFGYRDGATWKFKMEELERVADEMGVVLGGAVKPAAEGGSAIDKDLDQLFAQIVSADGRPMKLLSDAVGLDEQRLVIG